MAGKPYQSKLNPFREEIAELRRPWPPTPYVRIAEILNERHPGLDVSPNAIWSFVKTRALGPSKKQFRLPENEPSTQRPAPQPQHPAESAGGDPRRPEKGKPLYQAEAKENENPFAI